jgi:hypothetical protein
MVRLGPKDFLSEEWVARLAGSAGLPQPEFLARFGKFARLAGASSADSEVISPGEPG